MADYQVSEEQEKIPFVTNDFADNDVDSNDSQVAAEKSGLRRQPFDTKTVGTWIIVGICITVLIALINAVLIVVMNNSIKNVSDDMNTKVSSIQMLSDKLGNQVDTNTVTKFTAPYNTPRTFQRDRGTCWDFATVNLLNWYYRKHGIEMGWLKENEYVRFSEQAYGITMIDACHKDRILCDTLGDGVVDNSTEGGEIGWLFYFPWMYDKLLPREVCPYYHEDSPATDLKCDGYEEAIKNNPIKYDIAKMNTIYTAKELRDSIYRTGKVHGWSSLVHVVNYYLPCIDYWNTTTACNAENRVRCPETYWNTEYCAVKSGPCWDMDGEFIDHGEMVVEGGHAMNAVGFNDEFVTRSGQKGGFLIKNSWEDKVYFETPGRGARGSHSIAYWMQEISDWDERILCPNPGNPVEFLSCSSQAKGPTGYKKVSRNYIPHMDKKQIPKTDFEQCLDVNWMNSLVNLTRQPTEFVCKSSDYCDVSKRYFLQESITNVKGDLMSLCMIEYTNGDQYGYVVCTPNLPSQMLAFIYAPIDSQMDMMPHSSDICGYYFWPYEVIEKQYGRYLGFYATDFEVTWSEQSYAFNKAKYPHLNYTLLELSTYTQESASFSGPYPYNHVRITE